MAFAQSEPDPQPATYLEGLCEVGRRHGRWIAAALVCALCASLAVCALRTPTYRARASLILDTSSQSKGILGELAALTSAPQAASEIELLRARTTAESTVADPTGPEDAERRLGLATLVDDLSERGLASLWRRPAAPAAGGLAARFAPREDPQAPQSLVLEFAAADRVRVARAGWLARLGFGARGRELALEPGRALEFEGAALALTPRGDLTGRRFLVRSLSREEAVLRVQQATRARETERNSGVIELLVDDSDPERAAATANALCNNYLERNQRRAERHASQTVDFIEAQLDDQLRALAEAESEVVALQAANPRSVDISKTAAALIDELAQLEVQRVQAQLARASVEQAEAHLAAGDVDALSRLSISSADLATAAYVASIAELTAEFELQERSDAGLFKGMLQEQALAVQARLDQLEVEIDLARETLRHVESDSAGAIARITNAGPGGTDPLLGAYVSELGEIEAEDAVLAQAFTAAHPDRALLARRAARLEQRIASLLANRLAGLAAEHESQSERLASYTDRIGAYPGDERARIQAAIARLRARTAAHLVSREAGLGDALQDLGREIERIEGILGALPEEERVLADPKRRLAAHSQIVQFLMSRQQEAEITRAATVSSAEFIDPATPPLHRFGPSVLLHGMGGLALGALCAALLVGLREARGRRVQSAAELEDASGLPVVGTIPDFRSGRLRIAGAGAHCLPLRDEPESPAAEAYRSLRASLKFALQSEDARVIACTSSTANEGKSMTNASLAWAFAAAGKRVLLVDGDMRRPSVHRYLGIALSPGLADVLESGADWTQCAVRSVAPQLDVLPAGLRPRSPGDLFQGSAFRAFVAEVREHYDLVVLDVPPALAVADIEGVAGLLDATFLLCRSDRLTTRVVALAAERLRRAGAPLAGALLNGQRVGTGHDGYGKAYGFDSYYSDARASG